MRKGIKWTGIIVSGMVLLVIVFLLLLQTDWAKNLIRDKLETYLRSKANTELHISAINYRLPKWVELDGVFLRDKSGDTLVSGNKLRIDINMWKLLKGQYQISKIALDDVTVKINRKANDSNFNYQFLVDAFSDTTQKNKKKSPVSISLDKIDISRTAIKWHDSYGGTFMDTRIGSFHATIDSLDIYAQKYILYEAAIADMVFDLRLLNIPDKAPLIIVNRTTAETQFPLIKIKQVQIDRSHIGFDGQNTGFRTANDITEMKLSSFSMVSPQQISIDQLRLRNSSLILERKDVQSMVNKTQPKDTAADRQMYTIQRAVLLNNTIAFNDLSVKSKTKGLDANHIQLQSLSGGINGFEYSGKDLKAHVDSLSAREQTGFILDSLRGDFAIKDTLIYAKNLFIKTPLSRISGNTIVYPQSLDEKYKGNLQNWFLFTNAVIAKKDLIFLAPVFMEKYKRQLAGVSFIYLTSDISGNSKRLGIKTISLHSDKNDINVNANGILYNAFSSNGIQYDLFILKAIASKSFIEPFVNTNGKQTIQLPPVISITGKLKGDLKQVTTDIVITSAYGMYADSISTDMIKKLTMHR